MVFSGLPGGEIAPGRPGGVDAAGAAPLEWRRGESTTSGAAAPPSAYTRLSAQDSSFVLVEHDGTQPYVCAVALFDPPSDGRPESGLEIARVRDYISSRLHLLPRYRQRLAFVPVQGLPIWIDDERFDVAYHVHHAGLPQPGGRRELQALTARIASQPLDRDRPLWEIWFVEGLANGGFAAIAKVHHCMVDGVSGVGVMTALLSPTPETGVRGRPVLVSAAGSFDAHAARGRRVGDGGSRRRGAARGRVRAHPALGGRRGRGCASPPPPGRRSPPGSPRSRPPR